MAHALVSNNGYSTLLSGITAVATTITVATGEGSRFPPVSGSNYFYATLIDASNNLEIVKVVARVGDVLTVLRGQDGTSARAYAALDRIELRPVAALFDDKVSFDGGTFTGPISVPAGAVLAQVPQSQEVVKRAGDVMTGPLTVPTLQGTAGVVDVPAGHRIEGNDIGSIVAPGMVIQTVYLRTDTVTTYTKTMPLLSVPDYLEISALNASITPKYASSKILIWYQVSGDPDASGQTTWNIDRNGTVVSRNTGGTERWWGTVPLGYTPVDSRSSSWTFFYLDSPATTSTLTYKLMNMYSRDSNFSFTFYLNRPAGAAPQSQYEAGISQVLLMEIAQ